MTVEEPIAPTRLQALLADLSTCVCTELEAATGPLCWCGVWPGDEVSWEGCECHDACGMGWARLVGSFPYESFPSPAVDVTCRLPLAYVVEVGALRCMPTANEDGSIPDPAAVAEAAMRQYADMDALYRALKCCPADQIAVEAWVPLGPQGGCVGGGWTAYVSLD